jgi:hypothetical protein
MITILSIAIVYLLSFVGTGLIVDHEFHEDRFTQTDYNSGMFWTVVPVANTILLAINLVTWLVYKLSYGLTK